MKYAIECQISDENELLQQVTPIPSWDVVVERNNKHRDRHYMMKNNEGKYIYINPYESLDKNEAHPDATFYELSEQQFKELTKKKIINCKVEMLTAADLNTILNMRTGSMAILQELSAEEPSSFEVLATMIPVIAGPFGGILNYVSKVERFEKTYGREPNQQERAVFKRDAVAHTFCYVASYAGMYAAIESAKFLMLMLNVTPQGLLLNVALALSAGLGMAIFTVSAKMMEEKAQYGKVTSSKGELAKLFLTSFVSGVLSYMVACIPFASIIAPAAGKFIARGINSGLSLICLASSCMLLSRAAGWIKKLKSAPEVDYTVEMALKSLEQASNDSFARMEITPRAHAFWDAFYHEVDANTLPSRWQLADLSESKVINPQTLSALGELLKQEQVDKQDPISVKGYAKRCREVTTALLFNEDASLKDWVIELAEANQYNGKYDLQDKRALFDKTLEQMIRQGMGDIPHLDSVISDAKMSDVEFERLIKAVCDESQVSEQLGHPPTKVLDKIAKSNLQTALHIIERDAIEKSKFRQKRLQGTRIVIDGKKHHVPEQTARLHHVIKAGLEDGKDPLEIEKEVETLLKQALTDGGDRESRQCYSEVYRHVALHNEAHIQQDQYIQEAVLSASN